MTDSTDTSSNPERQDNADRAKPPPRMPPKRAGSSDIFQTPKSAIDVILPFIPKRWHIWECASGAGQIVSILKGAGYNVTGTDIMHGFDFLSPLSGVPSNIDCILTNPPYSVKDEWLERCYEIGKPFALLPPITALGEQNRVTLYRRHGIQLVLPPGRTNYGTPSGEGSGAWFYSAWFCLGLDLPLANHHSVEVWLERGARPIMAWAMNDQTKCCHLPATTNAGHSPRRPINCAELFS